MGYDRVGDGDKLMLTLKRLWAAEFRGNCSKFYEQFLNFKDS